MEAGLEKLQAAAKRGVCGMRGSQISGWGD